MDQGGMSQKVLLVEKNSKITLEMMVKMDDVFVYH